MTQDEFNDLMRGYELSKAAEQWERERKWREWDAEAAENEPPKWQVALMALFLLFLFTLPLVLLSFADDFGKVLFP